MIKLKVNDNILNIPNEYSEIAISTGIEVLEFVKDSSKLTINDKIAIISSLSKAQIETIQLFSDKTINEIYSNLNFIHKNEHLLRYIPTFKLDKTIYGVVDFKHLTVHEYADIEFYLTESEYPLQYLDKILTVMYRPIINKKQTIKDILINKGIKLFFKNVVPQLYESYTIKKYSEEDNERNELFGKRLDMGFAIAAFNVLISEREKINAQYPTLFKQPIKEEDKDQYDDPELTKDRIKPFEQVWGLYHAIASISNSLFERDAWKEKTIYEFFTYLSYFYQKVNLENMRARAQQNS